MADIFDVLADQTRRDLLQRLLERARSGASDGEFSVSELVTELETSQPTVSKHLKVLRDHGLVRVREKGQHRYYRVDTAPLREVEEWLDPFLYADEGSTGAAAFAAWAGADVGDKVGRAAAETAHNARAALEAAQEKLQGAQKRVTERLPWRH